VLISKQEVAQTEIQEHAPEPAIEDFLAAPALDGKPQFYA
jgi:hypothetical protein